MILPLPFRRVVSVVVLALAALAPWPVAQAVTSGRAVDYSDIWYAAGEDGWGINFVQSDTFIYGTFFIFGADKKPTWVTANLLWDGNSKYTGIVYSYQGSYYAGAWNPAEHVELQIGTASFTPDTNNASVGALSYTITGVGTVAKSLRRLTLTTIPIVGTYIGGQSGAYTGCSNGANNALYADTFTLQVSQSSGIASLVFKYDGLATTCTYAGAMTQSASLHAIPSATYKCSDGLDTGAVLSDVRITAQGIEGRIAAPDVGGACREDARFSAVLY